MTHVNALKSLTGFSPTGFFADLLWHCYHTEHPAPLSIWRFAFQTCPLSSEQEEAPFLLHVRRHGLRGEREEVAQSQLSLVRFSRILSWLSRRVENKLSCLSQRRQTPMAWRTREGWVEEEWILRFFTAILDRKLDKLLWRDSVEVGGIPLRKKH